MKNRTLACALLAASLSGCAAFDELIEEARQQATQSADAQLDRALWWLCRGATMGAFVRKYRGQEAKIDAYATLCYSESEFAPPTGSS